MKIHNIYEWYYQNQYICKIYIVAIKYIHVNNCYKLGPPPEPEASVPPLDNNVESSIWGGDGGLLLLKEIGVGMLLKYIVFSLLI